MNNSKLLKTIVFLEKINKDFNNNRLRILSSNRIHKSKFVFFRYLISNKDFRNLPYCDILINYFKKSELLYPGSSYFLSTYIVEKILKGRNIFNNVQKTEKNLENLKKYLCQNTSEKAYDIIDSVLSFAGPNATLSCLSSENNEISVKKSKNPLFDVSIHKEFAPIYFSKSKSKTQTYLISVIDAYIERESEVFSLIEECKKNNLPLMLFCRGISYNAINALKNIILRNNIHILPYVIKFDNSDPFKLEDIASVLGCKLLSIETGDNIYKDIVDKSSVGMIRAFWNKIEIMNPHAEQLNKKINEKLSTNNDADLKKYLFKRKSRINTNVVEISIPNREIELLSEIKSLVVCYNNIAVFGLLKHNNSILSKKCIDIATTLGESLISNLNSIGYIVLNHKRE